MTTDITTRTLEVNGLSSNPAQNQIESEASSDHSVSNIAHILSEGFNEEALSCAAKPCQPPSDSELKTQQAIDNNKPNWEIIATLMTVANEAPDFITNIIHVESSKPLSWSVDLYQHNPLTMQIDTPTQVIVFEEELTAPSSLNFFTEGSHHWPMILSVAIDKALKSSPDGMINGIHHATPEQIMQTLFGNRDANLLPIILPEDPRKLGEKLAHQWFTALTRKRQTDIQADVKNSKTCTFAFHCSVSRAKNLPWPCLCIGRTILAPVIASAAGDSDSDSKE